MLSRSEQETIIRFDETGAPARIYTASRRVAGVLQRRGLVPVEMTRSGDEITGWFFEAPKYDVLLRTKKGTIRPAGKRPKEKPQK